jgi:hypothetical protein
MIHERAYPPARQTVVAIEPFATRDELIEAEMIAIKAEFPRFNKVYNTRTLQGELVENKGGQQ